MSRVITGDGDEVTTRSVVLDVRAFARAFVLAWVLLVLATLTTGLLITRVLADDGVGRWDRSVVDAFARHRTPAWDSLSTVGSRLAETPTVIVVAVAAVLVLVKAGRLAAAWFLGSALVAEVSVFLVATLVIDRDRPPVAHLDAAPPTSSFPSGHTAAAVVLYVALAAFVAPTLRARAARVALWCLAVAVPVFVALSRLYRGMHHPTDVIAGALLGAGSLAVAQRATQQACRESIDADDRKELAA